MADTMDVRTSLAMGRGAIAVSPFEGLLRAEGLPLDLSRGDHHAVVVFPSSCCAHHASIPLPLHRPGLAAFDTAEHAIIVSGLRFLLDSGPQDAGQTQLPLDPSSSFQLTYGQLIALGGDFYGDPNAPICKAADPIVQFQSNFHQLLTLGPQEVPAIWAAANTFEFSPIEARSRLNYNPSGVYASMPTTGSAVTIPIPGFGNLSIPHLVSDEDRAFDTATGGTLLSNGRYLNLAKSNFDHFGVDAITAYQAGHTLAQTQASSATKETNGFRRDRLLRQAYAINAFADHFLTDLFAAGHMRTPRRALDDSATTMPKVLPGLLSKVMHDEDNKLGIWVENSMGDVWVAYGDGRYRDPPNAANRRIMRMAILASMNDVWNAYKNPGKPPLQSALAYVPKVITEITQAGTAVKHRDDPRNWSPLFWYNPADQTNYMRQPQYIPTRAPATYGAQVSIPRPWGNTWTLAGTTIEFYSSGTPVPLLPKSEFPPGFSYPPDETGKTGEYGWPPEPHAHGTAAIPGAARPMLYPTQGGYLAGPDIPPGIPPGSTGFWNVDWAPGPTALAGPTSHS